MTQETPSILLIDWATKYLTFTKSKFVDKAWKEKRALFRYFFRTILPDLPADQLHPGDVLSYLQAVNDSRSGYVANKDRKNLVAA